MRRERLETSYSGLAPVWRPHRGLRRDEAAAYVGVSASKFDQLVADGRMPKPIRIDGRRVWDLRQLDVAFDALSDHNETNPWDMD